MLLVARKAKKVDAGRGGKRLRFSARIPAGKWTQELIGLLFVTGVQTPDFKEIWTGLRLKQNIHTMRQNQLHCRLGKLFFMGSPNLPWKHGTRQQG